MSSQKLTHWLQFGIGICIMLFVYQLANTYRVRIDMTEEKRYSLSEPTKAALEKLPGNVVVELYLAGELPSNFIRFQKSILEILDEFSFYANQNIDIKLVDPAQASSSRARNQFYQGLVNQGLQPTNLNYTKDGETTQKILFPGAIISLYGQELAVNLLSGDRTTRPEEIINQSIESLEYELISAIGQLAGDSKKRIGLVTGHGEPDSLQLAGLTSLLLSKYDVFKLNLPNRRGPITGYDLLMITKPTKPFSEIEKYQLDQFIMKGGKVAFFLDVLRVNMDSASGAGTVAIPYETNLNDMLFKYGVRINQNYVVDLNCGDFPVVAGNMGDQPQIRMLPWPYFPLISNYGNHPAVKNMDAVLVRFASTIDTVKAPGIKKSPLMLTSANSKVMGAPITVSFNDLRTTLMPEKFVAGPQTIAYLLEGSFSSMYKNRFPPKGIKKNEVIESGEESKVIVIADGDVIRNELSLEDGNPLALGVSPYSQTSYANESLVMNLVDYMLDEEGLIVTRAKEIKLRPLDKVKVKEERSYWQIINLIIPIVILIVFGLVKMIIRKQVNRKRYES